LRTSMRGIFEVAPVSCCVDATGAGPQAYGRAMAAKSQNTDPLCFLCVLSKIVPSNPV